MYGDYEAQRHWMEITTNLPVNEWYQNSSNNDLLYWGLDYPPLTAYVSWLCGKISMLVEPQSMQLFYSRGYETNTHKLFMRLSVVVLDALVYFPSVWSVLLHMYPKDKLKRNWAFVFAMTQPAMLLIDHGHFQYNSVCLGLSFLAVSSILSGKDVLGSLYFSLALNFKQIALYYSPAFFFVLLRNCFCKPTWQGGLAHFMKLGATVLATFLVLWLPFCLPSFPGTTCAGSLGQVIHRLFPFSRGVFEDKVANLWYFLDVFVRIRQRFDRPVLVLLSLLATLVLLAPTAYISFRRKASPKSFLLLLAGSSLSFFIASFHVHEKSILFPLAPISLLMVEHMQIVKWFTLLCTFSMFPLIVKDGLVLQYMACTVLFALLGMQYSKSSTGNSCSTEQRTHYDQLLHFLLKE